MVVQCEAHGEQETAFEDSGRHRRIADGSQQDCVVTTQRLEVGLGEEFTVTVVAASAEIELGGAHRRDDRFEDAERLPR